MNRIIYFLIVGITMKKKLFMLSVLNFCIGINVNAQKAQNGNIDHSDQTHNQKAGQQEEVTIFDYNKERDFSEIKAIFDTMDEHTAKLFGGKDIPESIVNFPNGPTQLLPEHIKMGSDIKVLRTNERLVGFICTDFMEKLKTHEIFGCTIAPILIANEFRAKGYGARLIKASIEFCAKIGSNELSLNVHPENVNAIKLYSKMGFKETFRDQDVVAMSLALNASKYGSQEEVTISGYDKERDFAEIESIFNVMDESEAALFGGKEIPEAIMNFPQDPMQALDGTRTYDDIRILRTEKHLVGFIITRVVEERETHKARECMVAPIIVAKEFRGKGYGAYLIKASIEFCTKIGSQILMLHVDPKNVNAIKLYAKMGFKEIKSEDGTTFMEMTLPENVSKK